MATASRVKSACIPSVSSRTTRRKSSLMANVARSVPSGVRSVTRPSSLVACSRDGGGALGGSIATPSGLRGSVGSSLAVFTLLHACSETTPTAIATALAEALDDGVVRTGERDDRTVGHLGPLGREQLVLEVAANQ